jgi:hypothetical protein
MATRSTTCLYAVVALTLTCVQVRVALPTPLAATNPVINLHGHSSLLSISAPRLPTTHHPHL